MTNFGTHLNVELQQRGIEYAQLFTKHVALRPAIMERIPPMEHKQSHQGLTNGSSGGNVVSNGDDDMLMDDLNSFTTTNITSHSAPATKDSVINNLIPNGVHFCFLIVDFFLFRILCSIYWVDWTILIMALPRW